MTAPTLWEEGRMSGRRVTRLAAICALVIAALDLLLTSRLGLLFDLGFVLVCIGAALSVRAEDFFPVGVLPPLLLLGMVTVVAVLHPASVAESGDGPVQAVVSGLAHHASALLVGYLLALAVLAVRQKVLTGRSDRAVP